MNIIIYLLIGLIVGVVLGWLISKRRSRLDMNQKQHDLRNERRKKIISIVSERGRVTNNDIETELGISDTTATTYLQELEKEGKITHHEEGRNVYYSIN